MAKAKRPSLPPLIDADGLLIKATPALVARRRVGRRARRLRKPGKGESVLHIPISQEKKKTVLLLCEHLSTAISGPRPRVVNERYDLRIMTDHDIVNKVSHGMVLPLLK